jgi:hypothetical protein
MYRWNSLIFWVDIETRLLKCYDMEHKATIFFEGSYKNVDGLSLSIDFIKDKYSHVKVLYPRIIFNKNILYC